MPQIKTFPTVYNPTMPQVVEAQPGGRLPVPQDIRDKLKIQTKKKFVIFPVGASIIFSPFEMENLDQEDLIIKQAMRKRKITLKSLIETTEQEGKLLYKELYGQKEKK